MIRLVNVLPMAMAAGMACSTPSLAQEATPAEPAAPPREMVKRPDTRFEFDTVIIPGTLEAGQEKPEAKARRALFTLQQPALPQAIQRRYELIDPLEVKFGLKMAPLDEVLRTQLQIAKGQGVVVVEVKPGSLSEQAGLKPSDILLNLGGKDLLGVDQARTTLLALGKEAIEVKLIREGKPRRMSLVGPDHGSTPESSEFWIGVPVSPVDATLRSHLTELPADAGLIANDVVKASPADRAGVKRNDILVSLGGKPLKTADDLIAQVQASQGKETSLVLLRVGKTTTLAVTPTKRAHPTVITLNGAGGGPGNVQYRVMQPQAAITDAVDPFRMYYGYFLNPPQAKPGEKSNDIQIELFTNRLRALDGEVNARIEAQLKDLAAKVEEIRKALEGMKKGEGK